MPDPRKWISEFRGALGYGLGLKECYKIYMSNKHRPPEEVGKAYSDKPRPIDHKSACNLLLDILHSLEARGINLTTPEDRKWIKATGLLNP